MAKPTVITIHGVNPNRDWQMNVQRILEPHFDWRQVVYHAYDSWRGPIRAVINIPLLLLAGMCFIVTAALAVRPGWLAAIAAFFLGGLLRLCGFGWAWY